MLRLGDLSGRAERGTRGSGYSGEKIREGFDDPPRAVPPVTTRASNLRAPQRVTLRKHASGSLRGNVTPRTPGNALRSRLAVPASCPTSLKMTSLYSSPGLRRAASWFNTRGSRCTT